MSEATDPTRLSESTSDSERRLAQLFRAGERDLPSATQLDSLATRLAPVFAAPPAPAAAPRPGISKLALGGLGALVVGAIVAGYLWSRPTAQVETPPAAPSEPAPQAPLAAAPSAPATPSANVEPPAEPPSASADAAPSAMKSARERVPAEAKLLEQARRALATNPSQALAITRRHQALYPNGTLAQEREVIAIEALRRLGQSGQASERAGSFEQKYPDSAHRRTVEKGLSK